MRKQNIEAAAFELATQVRVVEDSIDTTLTEMAELQQRLVQARARMGVSVVTGHAAFEQLATALQSMIAARGSIGGCHGALVEAKQFVPGLRTVSFGDVGDCPEETKTGSGNLRIVA